MAIVACLVFNTVVLYVLESDSPEYKGRSLLNGLLHSFLQTFMLLVAIGSHAPRRAIGKWMLCCWGLVVRARELRVTRAAFTRRLRRSHHGVCACAQVLTLVAWYTADLASTLVAAGKLEGDINSMREFIAGSNIMCIQGAEETFLQWNTAKYNQKPDGLLTNVIETCPDMPCSTMDYMFDLVDAGVCNGITVSQQGFQSYAFRERHLPAAETRACTMKLAGTPIQKFNSGWATNLMSPCLATAFDYAFQVLRDRGTIEEIENAWLSPFHFDDCPIPEAPVIDSRASTPIRRLPRTHAVAVACVAPCAIMPNSSTTGTRKVLSCARTCAPLPRLRCW
eukprot:2388571-Prymnesium_polylepis.1